MSSHTMAPLPTPREREVLAKLAEGLRNREIADDLGVTERTVRFHLEQLFQKLEVGSRLRLIRAAAAHGWLA